MAKKTATKKLKIVRGEGRVNFRNTGIPNSEPVSLVEKKVIQPLSVDYPSEGLNDMARKINEIIEDING